MVRLSLGSYTPLLANANPEGNIFSAERGPMYPRLPAVQLVAESMTRPCPDARTNGKSSSATRFWYRLNCNVPACEDLNMFEALKKVITREYLRTLLLQGQQEFRYPIYIRSHLRIAVWDQSKDGRP